MGTVRRSSTLLKTRVGEVPNIFTVCRRGDAYEGGTAKRGIYAGGGDRTLMNPHPFPANEVILIRHTDDIDSVEELRIWN